MGPPPDGLPDIYEPVETFTFDVSADADPTSRSVRPAVELPAAVQDDSSSFQADFEESATVQRKRSRSVFGSSLYRYAAKKFGAHSSWLISVVAHTIAFILFSYIAIQTFKEPVELTLTSVSAAMGDNISFEDLSGESLTGSDNIEGQLGNELAEASADFAGEIDTQAGLGELTGGMLAEDLGTGMETRMGDGSTFGDPGGLFGAQGNGLADVLPSGGSLTASFFGTKVDGRRILYVLDNSGGMRDGGFEALVEELTRSVESLTEEQEFYVIFYSDMVYPMFHPRPVERFVPANDRFKKRLSGWLESVEFCVGNTVDEAIVAAGMIRPDALYLLTDGDIDTTRDGRKLAALVDSRGRDFPIHTFGIGMSEGSKAAVNLQTVADANGGKFRIVEISGEAKQRARAMNRPYHNKEPGPVWGLNVGSGWGRK